MFINKHNLKVADFASKDTVRPVLNAVKFEPGRTIATDGVKLCIVETPKIEEKDFDELTGKDVDYLLKLPKRTKSWEGIVPVEMVKEVSRSLPKNSSLPILDNAYISENSDSQTVEIVTTDLSISRKPQAMTVQGNFPDVDKMLEEKVKKVAPQARVTIDIKLLKEIAASLETMTDKNNYVELELRGQNDPVVLRTTTPENQEVTAVVMPIRSEEK